MAKYTLEILATVAAIQSTTGNGMISEDPCGGLGVPVPIYISLSFHNLTMEVERWPALMGTFCFLGTHPE